MPADDPQPVEPSLVLIPTELEATRLSDLGGFEREGVVTEVCGFGPVAAAARTAQLLAELGPRRVLLVGICGAYDVERHPPGTALTFARVAIDGVGVGEGERFLGPPKLGFPQWPGGGDTPRVADELELAPRGEPDADLLLTTCGASDSAAHAAERRERYPEAMGEDMEGFGVALACALQGVPCAIVRGVSNLVGDREPSHWRIPAALVGARRAALEQLERGGEPA